MITEQGRHRAALAGLVLTVALCIPTTDFAQGSGPYEPDDHTLILYHADHPRDGAFPGNAREPVISPLRYFVPGKEPRSTASR